MQMADAQSHQSIHPLRGASPSGLRTHKSRGSDEQGFASTRALEPVCTASDVPMSRGIRLESFLQSDGWMGFGSVMLLPEVVARTFNCSHLALPFCNATVTTPRWVLCRLRARYRRRCLRHRFRCGVVRA